MLETLPFYIFAAITLASAIMVVTRKSTITAAMFLALSLISVAGLYVWLSAEFLFAVQVLVYTGGVMVLFLFVIMLVNLEELEHIRPNIRRWGLPFVFVIFCFLALAKYAAVGNIHAATGNASSLELLGSNTKAVALTLFTEYLLLFEIVSVLLLVAMIGAIVLAKREI